MTPTQNTAAGIAERQEVPSGELRGRRLFLARALWVGVVSLTAFIFAASVPAHLADLHRTCAAEPCVAGQLSPGDMRALVTLGVPIEAYGSLAGISAAMYAAGLVFAFLTLGVADPVTDGKPAAEKRYL